MAAAGKKIGREKKRKADGRTHPISLFVRNKISAKEYWERTGQSLSKVKVEQ